MSSPNCSQKLVKATADIWAFSLSVLIYVAMELSRYEQIKNNYCVLYLGDSIEYLRQLSADRPAVEQQFPGLKVFIGCKDEYTELLSEFANILSATELRSGKAPITYIRRIERDVRPLAALVSG